MMQGCDRKGRFISSLIQKISVKETFRNISHFQKHLTSHTHKTNSYNGNDAERISESLSLV